MKKITAPKVDKKMVGYVKAFPQVEQAFQSWKDGTSLSDIVTTFKLPKRDTAYKPFLVLAGGIDAFKALRTQGAGGRSFGGTGGTPRTREARTQDDAKVMTVRCSPNWKVENVYEPTIVVIKNIDGKNNEGRMAWRALKARIHISPKGNRYVECKATERADLLLRVPLTTVQYSKAVKALHDAEAHANKCRKCGSAMEWRCTPYGHAQHLACTNWPVCQSTRFEARSVGPKRRARLENEILVERAICTFSVMRLRKYATSATAKRIKKDAALVQHGVKAHKAKVQARKTAKVVIAKKAREVATDKKRATTVVKRKKVVR